MSESKFIEPNKIGYTVYTKSNCIYCTNVKTLLSKVSDLSLIDCDAYLLDQRDAFLEWIKTIVGKEYKTFPIVFYNGFFIGGFTETKEYYDSINSFAYLENF